VRSRPPLACGGEARDQKAGSPGAVRLRQAGDIPEDWSPATRPAWRAEDEIRAPATLVEAIRMRSRTRVRFPPSPLISQAAPPDRGRRPALLPAHRRRQLHRGFARGPVAQAASRGDERLDERVAGALVPDQAQRRAVGIRSGTPARPGRRFTSIATLSGAAMIDCPPGLLRSQPGRPASCIAWRADSNARRQPGSESATDRLKVRSQTRIRPRTLLPAPRGADPRPRECPRWRR